MARTNETYYAVINSPLLTDAMRQVYHVLWTPVEGLTKAEIVQQCELQGMQKNNNDPWEKAVPVMVKMGILKKGNKRHCTAKHKEDVTWLLTDSAPAKPKANKPSAKQYIKAIAQFEMLIAQHKSYGDGLITPELEKLYDWVRDKVPDQK